MNRESLRALLIEQEGNELKPYFDCCGKFFRDCKCEKQGKLTIGVGRNIEDNGISNAESFYLLENDMSRVVSESRTKLFWFNLLDDLRQNVICSMVFNLGMEKFFGFKKMLSAIAAKDFAQAASEMLSSTWASEVGKRAVMLAQMMRDGDPIH